MNMRLYRRRGGHRTNHDLQRVQRNHYEGLVNHGPNVWRGGHRATMERGRNDSVSTSSTERTWAGQGFDDPVTVPPRVRHPRQFLPRRGRRTFLMRRRLKKLTVTDLSLPRFRGHRGYAASARKRQSVSASFGLR